MAKRGKRQHRRAHLSLSLTVLSHFMVKVSEEARGGGGGWKRRDGEVMMAMKTVHESVVVPYGGG